MFRQAVQMFSSFIIVLGSLGCYGWFASQKEAEMTSRPRENVYVQQYNHLLSYALAHNLFYYSNNHTGRVAWNTSYFMDSLLNIFLVTRDTHYLDLFVTYGDAVLSIRDDMLNRRDFTGRARPGWQANAYYTLGKPYILPTVTGEPALRVQGIHLSGNDHTIVRIISEDEQRFTIEVRNDFRRTTPQVIRYPGLTMDTVESVINARVSPRDYIRVERIGDAPPSEGVYPLRQTYAAVLHGEHTPAIIIPFVRFVAIVYKNNLINYYEKADFYLQKVLESYQDYVKLWRVDTQGGYFIFDPEAPFWCAGCPVPYNGLALHGRFLLWLSLVTGEDAYRQRAMVLAHRLRRAMEITPEGTLRMPYWYGFPFQGWSSDEEGPTNRLYVQSNPFAASEDTSHFTLTLQFLLDILDQGIPFDIEWAQSAARTYTEVLWRPNCLSQGKSLAHNLEGRGCIAGFPAGVYVRLSRFDTRVFPISLEIYTSFYTDPRNVDADYEYGYVMLGWSLLAIQSLSAETMGSE